MHKLDYKISEFLRTLQDDILDENDFIRASELKNKVKNYENAISRFQFLKSESANYKEFAEKLSKDKILLVLLKQILQINDSYVKNDIESLLNSDEIQELIYSVESIKDLFTGVLLGLEVNKRKNRRGRVFESKVLSKIEEILNHFSQSENLELAFKKHHTISKNGKNKELDGAIFYLNKLIIGIEINFYTTSGSKVTELFERAYPDLQNTLVSMGANLLIVTDGKGWRIMRKTIRNAFYRLENICNYYQLEEKLTSLLQKILK